MAGGENRYPSLACSQVTHLYFRRQEAGRACPHVHTAAAVKYSAAVYLTEMPQYSVKLPSANRNNIIIQQEVIGVIKKEMIAMLLAGGQGSRLGVLTSKVAKPAVAFGGKYRIIDFPLSNCINSGVDTVGVLTQYQPLRLNTHIGIGIPWDLDKNIGGVTVLPPYEKSSNSEWYTGTANAIYQNLRYMELYNPDYVLILSGDHIYKMDYEVMLDFHKANNADVSIAVMPVPMEEASRFGIVITDENSRITEFQEKPEHPKSNLASHGHLHIYLEGPERSFNHVIRTEQL